MIVSTLLGTVAVARAQNLELGWFRVASGGGVSTGGGFEMRTIIGQHDASPTPPSGGGFEMTGGFLTVTRTLCACTSDMNNDGKRDAADITGFVECIVATGSNCACAEGDGVPGLSLADVTVFVSDILQGNSC